LLENVSRNPANGSDKAKTRKMTATWCKAQSSNVWDREQVACNQH